MPYRRKILIVEDDRINREILNNILSEKYEVLETENGRQALDILFEAGESISLIILDAMMPVMDGYTFLAKIKEHPELSFIPVIMMTRDINPENELIALKLGATDFISKVLQPEIIKRRVENIIQLRESSSMLNLFKYDTLTGLYTKEYFCLKVKELLLDNPDEKYCIICSNIDNFKLYNNRYGNEAGNVFLKETANILKELAKSGGGLCARFNADRFLFFQKLNKVKKDLENLNHSVGHSMPITLKGTSFRWGIYEIVDPNMPVEAMCDRAMMAVESIKGKYGKRFTYYDDVLFNKTMRERNITGSMEDAVLKNQFVVYFQPKYSLSNGRMIGAEALVRWNHPENGLVPPGNFIPLFEKNGFISTLDRYVWEEACKKLSQWKALGYNIVPVSVNVSLKDFSGDKLLGDVLDLTQKYGIEPKYLSLETTESAYTENTISVANTIAKIREKGFPVEMDDFGSGYSSLNMFSQIGVDILKMDMGFVKSETSKPVNQSIIKELISIAHRLGIKVVAEGVEEQSQVNRLRDAGCDYAQGYYFAKPMPAEQFEKLLKENAPIEHEYTADFALKDKSNLFLIEEDDTYREKLLELFCKDYEVISANNAQSAIEIIKTLNDRSVSVIILSITLPDGGAQTVLEAIHQNPNCRKISVLSTIRSHVHYEEERADIVAQTDDFFCKCHPLSDVRKRVENMVASVELKNMVAYLTDKANMDPLTKTFNRWGLSAAVSAAQEADFPMALCMFDLDNLKFINDTYGHDEGDKTLMRFVSLLKSETRKTDIICRYGGDEFVVILTVATDSDAIQKRVDDICQKFADLFIDKPYKCSCSAGIVICNAFEKTVDEYISLADKAMYRIKGENKGTYCLHEE